ncbi:transposable element Tcb2 transposase [Trichonephila clavipes]|nr:transposable element Tcb2 transposase [Trichonephila clavipes]
MSPRRNKDKFQQLTEFKLGKIIGLREEGFSNHAIAARVQRNNESRFNLWDHDGRIRVRRYAGERYLPVCIIERHSGLTPGVMLWGFRIMTEPICYELRQDSARPHSSKAVRDFRSAQHIQLFPWPCYSLDISPIEHVWDLVVQYLARDPSPVASKDELLLRILVIWNYFPKADIQNLFDSVPRRIAGLIAA